MKHKTSPYSILLASRDTLATVDRKIALAINDAIEKVMNLHKAASESSDPNMVKLAEDFWTMEAELPSEEDALNALFNALGLPEELTNGASVKVFSSEEELNAYLASEGAKEFHEGGKEH